MRLIVLVLMAMLASACSTRPATAWQPAAAEVVAWWVEDVAHGLPRVPGEIALVDAGPSDAAIARWASGSNVSGRWIPPVQLASRRTRWPALAAALSEGTVLRWDADGLVVPARTVTPSRRTEIETLVDSENADRRFLDGLILVLGSPDPQVERIYRHAIQSARRIHEDPSVAHAASLVDPAR